MKKNVLLSVAMAVLCMVPNISAAYFTTDQSATLLSDNVAMFTITYRFGLESEDLYMPIFASRDLANGANTGAVGFEILEDSEELVSVGEAAGIVLSTAQTQDGMYLAPAGEGATFTFVAFYVIPEDHPELDVALHMTELPFYMGDEKRPLKLNPSELSYYITPEVDLNRNIGAADKGMTVFGNNHELRTESIVITEN